MSIKYQKELQELRQRIPIGIQDGLLLLEKNNGNIDQAELLFKKDALLNVMSTTNSLEKLAIIKLEKYNYDTHLSVKDIEEEKYSYTELILKKFHGNIENKEIGLNRIAGEIEAIEELEHKDKFRFTIDHLNKLPPELFCLVMMTEWLNYESYEGLDYAIYFHFDIVIDQIENQLLLPQIAENLRNAKASYEIQTEEKRIKGPRKNTIDQIRTSGFIQQANTFESQRPLLIDTLHEFVKTHIKKFP